MYIKYLKINLQLYQEQVYDLLSPNRATLDIREDGRGICIPGLTEISVTDFSSTLQCLVQVIIFYDLDFEILLTVFIR